MRIDSSGNVGIGVTPSAWSAYKALQVGLNASFAGSTSGSVALLSTNAYFDGSSYKYITTDAATQYQQNTGEHIWRTAASGSAGATLTFSERMRIDSGGNVGIGTSTTTDAGVTITTSVTRDSTWDAKLALQSTVATDFPALFFSGCSSTSRYGAIVQTANTSGNNPAQITSTIAFVNTSSTACDISFATNGNIGTTNATERMRILSSGNILSLAGGSTTATGTGIAFPTTQSASSDANTLDDYEEGTWTPSVNSGFTSPAYAARAGTYTKIGNVVTFTLVVIMSSSTRAASIIQFSLPFTSRNATTAHNGGGASWAYLYEAIGNSTTTNVPMLYINNNAATMDCYSTTGIGFLGTDLSTANPYFYIGGSYLTA
jgi:hypothetical protein